MSVPTVSVIMPSYNVGKYIGEAMESILNQTFNDFEFIIIDDASSDNTINEIQKHKDPRIKIIENQDNSGPGACMNKAMRIAQGKYIARMDADDISHPSRIQKLYNFLEENSSIDVCGCSMQLFGNESNRVEFSSDHDEIVCGLFWKSAVPQGAVMMRKNIAQKKNLYYDESFRVGGDWKFWCSIKNHVRFSNLKEILYFYRRGEHNITVQSKDQSMERSSRIHRYLFNDFGISFNDNDLKSHRFILGMFSKEPTSIIVKSAYDWLQKLLEHNLSEKKYNHHYFKKISYGHWRRLFYRLVPFGFSVVWSYISVSRLNFSHILYYMKYLFNKNILRK